MKVRIKDYIKWWGPYQIADLLQYIGVSENRTDKIGEKLAKVEWLCNFLNWNYERKQRVVRVKLDKFDTYNLDCTLALIIHPSLVEFKTTLVSSNVGGYPANIDINDVPEHAKLADEFDRWIAVVDEMIWSFEQLKDGGNDDQFYSGEADILWDDPEPGVSLTEINMDSSGSTPVVTLSDSTTTSGYKVMRIGPNNTFEVDKEGQKLHHERIENGLRLFSKYYRSLWW